MNAHRLRKLLVLLCGGSITAAVACHAFLDPDDLVSGNASPVDDGGGPRPDGPVNADGEVSEDDGGTSLLDATDEPPEWKGQVPPCAPAPPAGSPLLAVVGGLPESVPACPPGYAPANVTGYGGIIGAGYTCEKGSCACGAFSGSPNDCTNRRLRYSSDPACTTDLGSEDLGAFGCRIVSQAGATHAMQVASIRVDSQSCPKSGQATMAAQAPRFGLEVHGCQLSGNPAGACPSGVVALTATKDAVLCYQTSQSCDNGYTETHNFATAKTVNDTRKCECRCAADGGLCSGGTVRSFAQGSFCVQGGVKVTATCRPLSDFGFQVDEDEAPTPQAGSATCTVTDPAKTGTVTANSATVRLCCLSKCEACRYASTAAGQPCATQLQACLGDTDCSLYRACAISRSCTTSTCSGCNDAGVPDSAPPPPGNPKYSDLKTCQTNACVADCTN